MLRAMFRQLAAILLCTVSTISRSALGSWSNNCGVVVSDATIIEHWENVLDWPDLNLTEPSILRADANRKQAGCNWEDEIYYATRYHFSLSPGVVLPTVRLAMSCGSRSQICCWGSLAILLPSTTESGHYSHYACDVWKR